MVPKERTIFYNGLVDSVTIELNQVDMIKVGDNAEVSNKICFFNCVERAIRNRHILQIDSAQGRCLSPGSVQLLKGLSCKIMLKPVSYPNWLLEPKCNALQTASTNVNKSNLLRDVNDCSMGYEEVTIVEPQAYRQRRITALRQP